MTKRGPRSSARPRTCPPPTAGEARQSGPMREGVWSMASAFSSASCSRVDWSRMRWAVAKFIQCERSPGSRLHAISKCTAAVAASLRSRASAPSQLRAVGSFSSSTSTASKWLRAWSRRPARLALSAWASCCWIPSIDMRRLRHSGPSPSSARLGGERAFSSRRNVIFGFSAALAPLTAGRGGLAESRTEPDNVHLCRPPQSPARAAQG